MLKNIPLYILLICYQFEQGVCDLKWTVIEKEESDFLATTLKASNRIDPAGEPNRAFQPEIEAKYVYNVDSTNGQRLIIFRYCFNKAISHFFAAIVVELDSFEVRRLGQFWQQMSMQTKRNRKKSEDKAKLEAEVYLYWAPHPFQEKWISWADTSLDLDNGYKLKMLWYVGDSGVVGIYGQGPSSPQSDSSYFLSLGSIQSGSISFAYSSGAHWSLGVIEAEVAKMLSEAYPYFDSRWLTKDQVDTSSINYLKNLENLTKLAERQIGGEDSRKLRLEKVKFVKPCDSPVAIFSFVGTTIPDMMIGGLSVNDTMKLTIFTDMIDDDEGYTGALKRYYTFAFSPELLQAEKGWFWPWEYKPDENRPIGEDWIQDEIRKISPFTLGLNDKIYLQKQRAADNGQTICVYEYKTRYFLCSIDYTRRNIAQVGGLRLPDQLHEDEVSAFLQRSYAYQKGPLPGTVQEKLVGIFSKIKEKFQKVKEGWESNKIEANSNDKWILEHRYVAVPTPPRTRGVANLHHLIWYQLICKVPIWNHTKRKNKDYFFEVLLVFSDEVEVIIPDKNMKAHSCKVRNNFQSFLTREHDRALSLSRLMF